MFNMIINLFLSSFFHFEVVACAAALHQDGVLPFAEAVAADPFPVSYRAESAFFVQFYAAGVLLEYDGLERPESFFLRETDQFLQ